MGPFYKPDAPFRSKVGEGYLLRGVVRSTVLCQALPGAIIELWLTGPDGRYGDDYRARVRTDESGRYQFESNKPGMYGGRPSHIHLRVTAARHKTLVTQHYPAEDQHSQTFDLVLRPAR
jgi:protocatechuate 3,4-dioxygenase beta subunit